MRKSSDKHINYGQVYNKVHGTSAKTARGFFIKRTIDRRFTVTIIATDMVRNTASQVMYSDDIMACYFFRFTLFLIPFFSLLLVYVSEEFEKKFNEEGEKRRLMLVPQRSLMEIHL